jgi:hypothetical protein
MQDRRFSAAELAALAGLPLPTLTFFLREGILKPSVQRATGRGRGHVFSFVDVLAAKALNAVRLPNAAAAPLGHLVRFWYSAAGRNLIASVAAAAGKKTAERTHVLLVTDGGVAVDVLPADLMAKHETSVVYCLDATAFVSTLLVDSTESLMRVDFREPGPSGRVPRKKQDIKKRSAKKALRAVMREAPAAMKKDAMGKKKRQP